MSYETMIWEQQEGVGRITLNRPDTLNAWNRQFGRDLGEIVTGEATDPSVRAVLITGSGRGFSSGADLKSTGDVDMHPDDDKPDIGRRLRELYHPIIKGIRELEKPVVAAVHGPAAGIGCSLALACDLILAAESAYFMLAFTRIGLMPDGGSTLFLPARVGKARTMELVLLAERLPAPKALEWGLINAVHPDDALMDEAEALVERLANGPTRAYAAAKQALNQAFYSHIDEQLELEAELQHGLFRTEDVIEGSLAFVQKREAAFTGA